MCCPCGVISVVIHWILNRWAPVWRVCVCVHFNIPPKKRKNTKNSSTKTDLTFSNYITFIINYSWHANSVFSMLFFLIFFSLSHFLPPSAVFMLLVLLLLFYVCQFGLSWRFYVHISMLILLQYSFPEQPKIK